MTVNDNKCHYLPLSAKPQKRCRIFASENEHTGTLFIKSNLKTLMSNPQKQPLTLWELLTTIPPGEKSSTSSSPSLRHSPPPSGHRAVCEFRWTMSDERLAIAQSTDDEDYEKTIHPLPPSGYSHLSQGESQLQNTALANCPTETGGRAKRRGWIYLNYQPLNLKL